MEMCLRLLLLTKYSFDVPETGNCIDKIKFSVTLPRPLKTDLKINIKRHWKIKSL